MSKRDTNWNTEKLKRFLGEGRGKGEGMFYKPWLTIQEYPTLGRATRIMGATSKRMHNFFSDLQLKYFYLLDWDEQIIDIREHYPLLNYDEIVKDKSDLNIKLFTDKVSGVPFVLTTTFYITLKLPDGGLKMVARSIKSASELEKKSSLEKLEIESRYWASKEVEFAVVTNKQIPAILVKNIEWLHSALILNEYEYNNFTRQELNELADGLLSRLISDTNAVRKITAQYEKDYSLEAGTGVFLIKYLMANRKIEVNMHEPINLSLKTSVLFKKVNNSYEGDGLDAISS